ncbi:MAG TPA: lipid-A-disaccharide synthase N-terminal domain-containing protein [Candidatus Krumholzibacteria bacterium]|nr:lipid-A-disaccharide synthase N-terminal domain-containing protein [Candidatus Krumholzibacteria bacterium]
MTLAAVKTFMDVEHAWLAVGLAGQIAFGGRFLVQWIVSERRRESVIPEAFWYMSLVGGALLLAYAIQRRDPVFILGQAFGALVYLRNIRLLAKRKRQAAQG